MKKFFTVIYNRPVMNTYLASKVVVKTESIDDWVKQAIKDGMDIAFVFEGKPKNIFLHLGE